MFYTLDRPSTCADLQVDPEAGQVLVTYKSGQVELHTGVNTGDIENLISNTTVSVGKFVNQVLLGNTVDASEQLIAA